MLVKLSVKTSAVLEKMHSSSWKTKVLLALSVKMGSVRTTQLLQIEREYCFSWLIQSLKSRKSKYRVLVKNL